MAIVVQDERQHLRGQDKGTNTGDLRSDSQIKYGKERRGTWQLNTRKRTNISIMSQRVLVVCLFLCPVPLSNVLHHEGGRELSFLQRKLSAFNNTVENKNVQLIAQSVPRSTAIAVMQLKDVLWKLCFYTQGHLSAAKFGNRKLLKRTKQGVCNVYAQVIERVPGLSISSVHRLVSELTGVSEQVSRLIPGSHSISFRYTCSEPRCATVPPPSRRASDN